MENDRAKKLIRDGEELAGRGFVKTYGFDETIVFIMSIAQQIWGITQEHKSFRMELFYDAETLNADYFFFVSTDKYDEGHGIAMERGDELKEKLDNWVSVSLPENCQNVCISFKREIAEMQIEKFGASPLYGFDGEKEDWLPVEIFITYGGLIAPNQQLLET